MVRPLTSGFLLNWLLPKSAVFSRVLGVLESCRTESGDLLPNVALYQTEPHLVIHFSWAPRALPVVTKSLSSLLRNSPIDKSLPLLFSRSFRHRRRSKTSPNWATPRYFLAQTLWILYHAMKYLSSICIKIFNTARQTLKLGFIGELDLCLGHLIHRRGGYYPPAKQERADGICPYEISVAIYNQTLLQIKTWTSYSIFLSSKNSIIVRRISEIIRTWVLYLDY